MFMVIMCMLIWGCLTLQCVDEEGASVDWLVLYKIPKLKNSNPYVNEGTAYLYITSKTLTQGWTLSNVPITNNQSIPGRIISQILLPSSDMAENKISELFWLLYNDEPPHTHYSTLFGHTKGIVMGTEHDGLWLVHSVPNFPSLSEGVYFYPESGYIYGQSFLCISMIQSTLNDIGLQLQYNHARVYQCQMSLELQLLYPELYQACGKQRIPTDSYHKEIVKSSDGVSFLSFAKSAKFAKDLYSGWVSDVLRSELYVESWIHVEELPTVCNQTYPVHNVEKILLDDGILFSSMNDHSKWAVSVNNTTSWVCIGDINRARDQFKRGGGTVCIENEILWRHYYKTVSAVDPCP